MKDSKIREIRQIRGNPRFRHYPEYKESDVEWIGEVPGYWNLVMLKHAARLVYGDTLISENREDGVVPVYGSNGIIDTHSSANTLSPAIIVGRKGSLGKVQYSDVPCFVIDTAYLIDRRTSNVNLRWLHYVLQSLKLERFRNSVLPGLNRESAESQYIPLISAEEQTQIANFLDRKTEQIDELIRIKERRIELLQEQRTALINQAVTKGLDRNVEMKPSGLEWIGGIPRHWNAVRCAHLFEVKHIKNTSGEINLSAYRDYGVIKRDSRDDNHNRVSEDTSNYKLVEPGDFVFNKMKCWQGSLGISEYRGIVSPAYTVCKTKRPFYGKYFHYLLRSWSYIQEFNRLSYGVRTGQWELRFEDFKNIIVPYPSAPEQAQISNFLDDQTKQIDELITAEQRKIELLKEYRQSLISEAVTGKIDVRNEV